MPSVDHVPVKPHRTHQQVTECQLSPYCMLHIWLELVTSARPFTGFLVPFILQSQLLLQNSSSFPV